MKDKFELGIQIKAIINDSNSSVFDFTGFVFNTDSPLRNDNVTKPLILDGCKFYSDLVYRGKTFTKSVILDNSTFIGELCFEDIIFEDQLSLIRVRIASHHTPFLLNDCVFESNLILKYSNIDRRFQCLGSVFTKGFLFDTTVFGGSVVMRTTVDSPSTFMKCRFKGFASFNDTQFMKDCSFWLCDFDDCVTINCANINDKLVFESCSFSGKNPQVGPAIQFWSTILIRGSQLAMRGCCVSNGMSFKEASLEGTTTLQDSRFRGFVDFSETSLGRLACDASGVPDHDMFIGGVSFFGIAKTKNTSIQFRHIDLRSAQFIDAPMEQIEFVACRWGKPKEELGDERYVKEAVKEFRNTEYGKNDIAREDAEKLGLSTKHDVPHAYIEVAQVYRRLQQKYLEYIDPYQAGVFHQKELKMVQQAIKHQIRYIISAERKWIGFKNLGLFVLYKLYNASSRYGESIGLPLLYVSLIVFGTPLLFMFMGISIAESPIHYTLSVPPTNVLEMLGDYFNILRETISVLLFRSQSSKFEGAPGWILFVESLLTPLFMTFLILAFRRRFKRKSY